ncbi:ATP-grasp domain-containing protein [Roseivirga sp.]|uniref:ATP-grasp domain-containing protein n=1 Tax=Roseivirga sp. TaxID=1964215 RepID=UPI003B52B08F
MKSKFYCLHEGYYEGVALRLQQFEEACNRKGVVFCAIDSLQADYSALPEPGVDDLLYNSCRGSEMLEDLLLNNEVKTIYRQTPSLRPHNVDTIPFSLLLDKHDIKAPKTIYKINRNDSYLKKYVEVLGGFPIILKTRSSTRGIGTIKVESWPSLISTVDYLTSIGQEFIMRSFIRARRGCRLIVLGNEVIASAVFRMQEGDFRNAATPGAPVYESMNLSDQLNNEAVRASHLANFDFSGVDFLEDEEGNFFLLEVNNPTGFSALIDVCGVDIPGKLLDYMLEK